MTTENHAIEMATQCVLVLWHFCCLTDGLTTILVQVPSFGILSNGTTYIFYKYTPEDRRLVKHVVRARLKKGIKADEAIVEVLPIIRHLLHIIQLHMQGMESYKRVRTSA